MLENMESVESDGGRSKDKNAYNMLHWVYSEGYIVECLHQLRH